MGLFDCLDSLKTTPVLLPEFLDCCRTGKTLTARGYKGDVNQAAWRSRTGLTIAAEYGQGHVVSMLVREMGAKLDYKDGQDDLALHLAVRSNSFETVKLIVEMGGEIDKEDKYGRAPISYAHTNGMLEHLIRLGADPNPRLSATFSDVVDYDPDYDSEYENIILGPYERCQYGWEAGREADLTKPLHRMKNVNDCRLWLPWIMEHTIAPSSGLTVHKSWESYFGIGETGVFK